MLLLILVAGGTAFAGAARTTGAESVHAATVAPLDLSSDMRRWARDVVADRGREIARLRQLHTALLDDADLTLGDDGFAFRFVAMARELGIPAYFVLVDDPAIAGDSGRLYPAEPRLAAGFGLDGRVVVFDATAVSRPAHRRLRVLTDRKAAAVVNRRAGERLLAENRPQAAIPRLETAVLLDPDMASGWSTLGVALRRAGQQSEALDAYERSIALALAR